MIELLAPETGQGQTSAAEITEGQSQPEAPAKRRYRTRSEIIFDKQSDRRMTLREQIDLVSKWLRAARSAKEAYRWSKHLDELRAKLPPHKPKSKPGVNMLRIRRAERADELNAAKRRIQDAGQYDRPQEGSGSI